MSSFALIHFSIGLMVVLSPEKLSGNGGPPPALFGWIFMLFGGLFVLFGWTLGGLMIYAGRCLQQRKKHTFCLVAAAVSCVMMPLGTVLGVFTIIVLTKPSVKQLFGLHPPDAPMN